MRWMGHVAHMGERTGVYGFWWVNLRKDMTWKTPA